MSTIDWPEALIPQEAQLVLRKSGRQFTSPFNGSTQSTDDIAERWVLSCTIPTVLRAENGGGLQSFCNALAGGVNRVRGWHFGSRGQPMGTLRGAPTLAVAAARGNQSISLTGCAVGDTLLADDMIGLGGHLLQVAANCAAVAGAMTVPLVNRIRGTIASGSVLTWYRPTADFILPAMQAGPVWQPGGIMQATALDLVEVYTP